MRHDFRLFIIFPEYGYFECIDFIILILQAFLQRGQDNYSRFSMKIFQRFIFLDAVYVYVAMAEQNYY